MPHKLLVLLCLLPLCSFAAAQTPLPSAKAAEDAAKLEKEAVEFLRETSDDVSRLRTLENRISFNAELASLMWFHDEKEAKAMYGGVVADFKQLLVQFDSQMNAAEIPDDDSPSGGIFGGYGKSKVERKFRIAMAVRQQIAMSLAEHAPDLAYNFFYDSLNLISNPQFRKETEDADKYFEARLMQLIAESDAAKAAEYGKESIKRGLDNNHIELLKKIYAKDPEKGIEFGSVILSKLKSDKDAVQTLNVYSMLLATGSDSIDASKKGKKKAPLYTREELRDIANIFASALLDCKNEEAEAYAPGFVDEIDKFAPGRGAQIRAKFKNSMASNSSVSAIDTATNTVRYGSGRGENYAANGANTATGISSNSAATKANEDREAREKAEQKMMEDLKNLGTKPLPKEDRDKIIAQARKIISQTPGKDKKIVALSLLAAQVARAGDRELADEIMSDAQRLVNPQPKNYQDFLFSWMLASGYAEVNPDKSFPLLESTIMRANDTIAAAVKVAEFIDTNDEMIDDGEVQVGMFGGSMMRDMTRGLGIANSTILALARADFGRTRNLVNTISRTEVRVLAKMLVLRAILDKTEGKKPMSEEMIDGMTKDQN